MLIDSKMKSRRMPDVTDIRFRIALRPGASRMENA